MCFITKFHNYLLQHTQVRRVSVQVWLVVEVLLKVLEVQHLQGEEVQGDLQDAPPLVLGVDVVIQENNLKKHILLKNI